METKLHCRGGRGAKRSNHRKIEAHFSFISLSMTYRLNSMFEILIFKSKELQQSEHGGTRGKDKIDSENGRD